VTSGTPGGWSAFFGVSADTGTVTVKAFAICSPGPGFSTSVISAASSFGVRAGGLSVACPSGGAAAGGGFSFTGGTNVALRSEPDVPSGVASGWFAFFGAGTGGTATAFALCMTAATSLSVNCSPSSVLAGAQTACSATVSNLDPTSSQTPSGPVTFSASRPGSFTPAQSCTLSGTGGSSSCSAHFAPSAGSVGVVSVTATYNGDADHLGSTGSSSLSVFDFTVTATPPTRTVLRGSSAPFTVTTALVPGSAGAPASVGLAVSGLPADASSGPSALALPGTRTLTIHTGAASLGDFASRFPARSKEAHGPLPPVFTSTTSPRQRLPAACRF
jgi:large repetitive protein